MPATELHPVLRGSPYRGYVYAYPHKTAYRPLAPIPLREVWRTEPRRGLFLYVHVPFCTMRCGFCNLFTTARPKSRRGDQGGTRGGFHPHDDLVTNYLAALRRQAEVVREALPDAQFARFAVGGGTPTYLSESELAEVFDIAGRVMGADLTATPSGVETSPDTLTAGKVELLKARGVERVSIGVQSFVEAEAANSGRPQSRAEVDAALSLLAGANFRTLNIDLIYGLPGQTVASWLDSLREALRYAPEELYLYPLYVRPLTALGQSHKEWDDVRLACYRAARDVLLAEGYEQVSMRMFRLRNAECGMRNETRNRERLPNAHRESANPQSAIRNPQLCYCCQEDGMVGLGCGARSYTRSLHYSLDYAVRPKGVKEIIADYLARTRHELAHAEHGFALNGDERKRRYLLQSILNSDGLDAARYAERFGTDPADDFPDLRDFAGLGLLAFDGAKWTPTALGLERSDALGPWFFSDRVRGLMEEYEAK